MCQICDQLDCFSSLCRLSLTLILLGLFFSHYTLLQNEKHLEVTVATGGRTTAAAIKEESEQLAVLEKPKHGDLKKTQKLNKELSKQNTQLSKAVESLRKERETLLSEKQKLKSENKLLEKELKRAMSSPSQSEIERLRQQLAKQGSPEESADNLELKEKVERLEAQLAKSQGEVATLQRKLDLQVELHHKRKKSLEREQQVGVEVHGVRTEMDVPEILMTAEENGDASGPVSITLDRLLEEQDVSSRLRRENAEQKLRILSLESELGQLHRSESASELESKGHKKLGGFFKKGRRHTLASDDSCREVESVATSKSSDNLSSNYEFSRSPRHRSLGHYVGSPSPSGAFYKKGRRHTLASDDSCREVESVATSKSSDNLSSNYELSRSPRHRGFGRYVGSPSPMPATLPFRTHSGSTIQQRGDTHTLQSCLKLALEEKRVLDERRKLLEADLHSANDQIEQLRRSMTHVRKISQGQEVEILKQTLKVALNDKTAFSEHVDVLQVEVESLRGRNGDLEKTLTDTVAQRDSRIRDLEEEVQRSRRGQEEESERVKRNLQLQNEKTRRELEQQNEQLRKELEQRTEDLKKEFEQVKSSSTKSSTMPSAINIKKPAVSTNPPAVSSKPPTPSTNPPAVSSKSPTASATPPAVSSKPPTAGATPPAVSSKPPTPSTNPPAVSSKPPTAGATPPAVSSKPPTPSTNPPAVSSKPPSVSTKPSTATSESGHPKLRRRLSSNSELATKVAAARALFEGKIEDSKAQAKAKQRRSSLKDGDRKSLSLIQSSSNGSDPSKEILSPTDSITSPTSPPSSSMVAPVVRCKSIDVSSSLSRKPGITSGSSNIPSSPQSKDTSSTAAPVVRCKSIDVSSSLSRKPGITSGSSNIPSSPQSKDTSSTAAPVVRCKSTDVSSSLSRKPGIPSGSNSCNPPSSGKLTTPATSSKVSICVKSSVSPSVSPRLGTRKEFLREPKADLSGPGSIPANSNSILPVPIPMSTQASTDSTARKETRSPEPISFQPTSKKEIKVGSINVRSQSFGDNSTQPPPHVRAKIPVTKTLSFSSQVTTTVYSQTTPTNLTTQSSSHQTTTMISPVKTSRVTLRQPTSRLNVANSMDVRRAASLQDITENTHSSSSSNGDFSRGSTSIAAVLTSSPVPLRANKRLSRDRPASYCRADTVNLASMISRLQEQEKRGGSSGGRPASFYGGDTGR